MVKLLSFNNSVHHFCDCYSMVMCVVGQQLMVHMKMNSRDLGMSGMYVSNSMQMSKLKIKKI